MIGPDPGEPETVVRRVLVGEAGQRVQGFLAGDRLPIPARDLPAGMPAWMASSGGWADRRAFGAVPKRASLLITVPRPAWDWRD